MEAVENQRHKIIHGMADEATESFGSPYPDAPIHISRDHPKHWFSERFSAQQILEIADDISAITGEMLRLYFHLYGAGRHP
jgi:hypothetical protein